jgi:uncharacterized membrane protein YhhN
MRGALIATSAALYIFLFVLTAPRAHLSGLLGPLPAHLLGVSVKVLPALLLSVFPARAHPRGRFSVHASRVSIALLLSAAGDALMDFCERTELGGEAAFLGGLGTFLLAHLFYCAGFLSTVERHSAPVALVTAFPSALVLKALSPHILGGKDASLFPAVCVYVAVITSMLYLSVVRGANGARGYWLTVGGAALFLFSDAVLAWDKFAPPPRVASSGAVRWWFRAPKVLVMASYYGAQALLASGAAAKGAEEEGRVERTGKKRI